MIGVLHIVVVWYTQIHLLHLMRDVRLLTLSLLIWRVGIVASLWAVVRGLAVNNLVRNLNLLIPFAILRGLHVRLSSLSKLHLKLLIILRVSWLLVQCLLFIIFHHSWEYWIGVKLRQKIMRWRETMFYFEEFLVSCGITFLLILVEVVILEWIFVENRLRLSLTLVRKRFKLSLWWWAIGPSKAIFIWDVLFLKYNFIFFNFAAIIFPSILRLSSSISAQIC